MTPTPRVRIAIGITAMVGIAGFGLLGLAWSVDRGRSWERPRWEPRRFVPLTEAAARPGDELWLVSVNPSCSHCMNELARRAREPRAGITLGALIVDTPRRPSAALVAALPVERVWWDRNGIWRRRWGHRLYGELLRFDARGNYLGPHEGEARASIDDSAAKGSSCERSVARSRSRCSRPW